ncbi:Hypothetical protein, putative, partial [Bodo saltans]
ERQQRAEEPPAAALTAADAPTLQGMFRAADGDFNTKERARLAHQQRHAAIDSAEDSVSSGRTPMLDDLFLLPELDVMERRLRHLHAEKPLVRHRVPVVRQDMIHKVEMNVLRIPPRYEDDVAHNLSYLVFAVTQRTVTNREE